MKNAQRVGFIFAAMLALAAPIAFARTLAVDFCHGISEFVKDCGALAAGHAFTALRVSGGVKFAGQDGIPSAEDFARYRVTNPSQSEVIRQRLYDWQLYATAGTAQLSFFSQAIGSGITTALGGTVGAGKSQWDTNMTLGGQLPSGINYLAESIEVVFLPGSVSTANTYTPENQSKFAAVAAAVVAGGLNDVNTFYQSGMLEFNVLQKNYCRETPLMAFPPKAHFDGVAASSSNSATTAEVFQGFTKAGGRPYYLEPKVLLQPAMNFEVLLKWPAAVATPSGFNARVGVILDGYMMRASQ